MPEADDPWIDKDFEAQVRDTAYFLWENDGRPHGREKEYWFTALDRCLRQREADALLQKEPPQDQGQSGSAEGRDTHLSRKQA
ncbi:MAG TPA: DUF2934 domain-containing protein [Devosia sp.]|jgi:hypothetical protein|uniref:DUF2934 domain-containing protein n=1 Tax=Devosia sp. TaxID=1871048 RepID=UPI002F9433A8